MIISELTDPCTISAQTKPSYLFAVFPIPTLQLLETTNIPVSIHLPFLDILHLGNYTVRGRFCLSSSRGMFSRLVPAVACISTSILLANGIFVWLEHASSIPK